MSEDYIAYAVCLGVFATGVSMLALLNFQETFLRVGGYYAGVEKTDGGLLLNSFAAPWEFWHVFMLFMSLAVLTAPAYIYYEVGANEFADPASRYTFIAAGVITLQASIFMGFVYKFYTLYSFSGKQNKRVQYSILTGHQSTNARIGANFAGSYYFPEMSHFILQNVCFMVFVIGCAVYVAVKPIGTGGFNGIASVLLFTSLIIIAVTVVVSWGNMKFGSLSSASMSDEELKGKLYSSKNEVTLPTMVAHLNLHGQKIPDFASKFEETINGPVKSVTGNSEEVLATDTPMGACLHVARTFTGNSTGPMYTRVVNGETYAFTNSSVVSDIDKMVDDDHNGILQNPKRFSTGRRMTTVRNRKPANASETTTDEFLDHEITAKGSTVEKNLDIATPYARIHRNLDRYATGCFSFYDFVWGFGSGLGLHVNFPKAVVFPYVMAMFPMNIYFLYSVMYGAMMWIITCIIPLMGALNGTFTQFFELHAYAFVIAWVGVFVTDAIVPTSSSSYIYSRDVWEVEYLNQTDLCGTAGCDENWDNVDAYFWGCIITFVLSVIMLLSEIYKGGVSNGWIGAKSGVMYASRGVAKGIDKTGKVVTGALSKAKGGYDRMRS